MRSSVGVERDKVVSGVTEGRGKAGKRGSERGGGGGGAGREREEETEGIS